MLSLKTTFSRIKSFAGPGYLMSKSERLIAKMDVTLTASSLTCTFAGNEIDLVMP